MKNTKNLSFAENLTSFFRNPKEYCNTFTRQNNKKRFQWIAIIYLIYIGLAFLTHNYIFYYSDSASPWFIIFYPIGIALIFVVIIFALLKILKFEAKFAEISMIYFKITALELILFQIITGILIILLVAIAFIYYLTIYILSKNKKNVLKIVLFFILLFIIGGLLQFFVFNKFVISMQKSFEYDKRHSEYGANWDFISDFDENTPLEDLKKGIEFCTNDWKENSRLDALECYEYIYPYYYKYDPALVESICLDDANIKPSHRGRNKDQLKCMQFIAKQKIINGNQTGIDICESSQINDQICLCKAGALFDLFEENLISQEEFYLGLKKAHNSSIFGCDKEINKLNEDKNFELPEFKFATVGFKIVPI